MPHGTISLLIITALPVLARADFYFLVPSVEPGGPLQLVWNDRASLNKHSHIPEDLRLKSGNSRLETRPGGPGWLAVTPTGPTTTATIEHGVVLRGQRDPALVLFYPKFQAEIRDLAEAVNTTLELSALRRGHGLAFRACFQGQPLANHEVIVMSPGQKRGKAVRTDSLGMTTSFDTPGLYSARIYHKETRTGEFQGRSYGEVRHYATLSVEFQP